MSEITIQDLNYKVDEITLQIARKASAANVAVQIDNQVTGMKRNVITEVDILMDSKLTENKILIQDNNDQIVLIKNDRTAIINEAVSKVVDDAPLALDTLKELSVAMLDNSDTAVVLTNTLTTTNTKVNTNLTEINTLKTRLDNFSDIDLSEVDQNVVFKQTLEHFNKISEGVYTENQDDYSTINFLMKDGSLINPNDGEYIWKDVVEVRENVLKNKAYVYTSEDEQYFSINIKEGFEYTPLSDDIVKFQLDTLGSFVIAKIGEVSESTYSDVKGKSYKISNGKIYDIKNSVVTEHTFAEGSAIGKIGKLDLTDILAYIAYTEDGFSYPISFERNNSIRNFTAKNVADPVDNYDIAHKEFVETKIDTYDIINKTFIQDQIENIPDGVFRIDAEENIMSNNSSNTINGLISNYSIINSSNNKLSESSCVSLLNSGNNNITISDRVSIHTSKDNTLSNCVLDSVILSSNNNAISNSYKQVILASDSNTIYNSGDIVILAGKANNVYRSNHIIIGGVNNTLKSNNTCDDNSIISGNSNCIQESNMTHLFGNRNILLTSHNSLVKGNGNKMNCTSNAIIIGGSNELSNANDVVIIGNNVDTTNASAYSLMVGFSDSSAATRLSFGVDKCGNVLIPNGAGEGKVLTSNRDGLGSWRNPTPDVYNYTTTATDNVIGFSKLRSSGNITLNHAGVVLNFSVNSVDSNISGNIVINNTTATNVTPQLSTDSMVIIKKINGDDIVVSANTVSVISWWFDGTFVFLTVGQNYA